LNLVEDVFPTELHPWPNSTNHLLSNQNMITNAICQLHLQP
jgi:hypothetical protein